MMRIGSGEMILIFALALFIFGPARLPELGRMVGKAVGSCKYYMDSFADECKGMEEDLKQVKCEVNENAVPPVRAAAKAEQQPPEKPPEEAEAQPETGAQQPQGEESAA